jgi:alpha-glucosidase (family GH31 glycosyl hydrolase)
VLNFQDDPNTYNLDDQFMVGEALMVAPILSPGVTERLVYLPKGTWYDYWTTKKYEGGTMIRVEAPLDTVPMFVRGGSIIAKAPAMNFVNEKPWDPISFEIYPDDNGSAQTELYEDDGLSPDYKKGEYRRTDVSVSRTRQGSQVSMKFDGQYNPGKRRLIFEIRSLGRSRTASVMDDGNPRTLYFR